MQTAARTPIDAAISRIACVLGGEVGREGVDGDDRAHTVGLDVLDLLAQVGPAEMDLFRVLLEDGGRQGTAGGDLVLA